MMARLGANDAGVIDLTPDGLALTVEVPAKTRLVESASGRRVEAHLILNIATTIDLVELTDVACDPSAFSGDERLIEKDIGANRFACVADRAGLYIGEVCDGPAGFRCRLVAAAESEARKALKICRSVKTTSAAPVATSPASTAMTPLDAALPEQAPKDGGSLQAATTATDAPAVGASARPTKITASSTHKPGAGYTFSASNLTDGDLTSSWQPTSTKQPIWFRLDFATQVRINAIGIANGFQTNDKFGDEFLRNSRIAKGRIRFSDGTEFPIQFAGDERGIVWFDAPATSTTSATVFIDEVFPGSKWNDLAVSELATR